MKLDRRAFLATSTGIAGALAGCTDNSQQDRTETTQNKATNGGGSEQSDNKITWAAVTREIDSQQFAAQNLIKNQFESLGLEFEFTPMEFGTLFEKFANHDFQLCTMGWSARPERLDPTPYLTAFHSDKAIKGGNNAAEYKSDEFDELMDNINSTLDRSERQQYVYDAQVKLAEDVPVAFLLHPHSLNGLNQKDFGNWQPQVGGFPYLNVWTLQNIEPNGGTDDVIWGTILDPPSLNPMGIHSNTGTMAMKLNYDRLIRLGLDGTPKPWAASDWNVVDDVTVDVTVRDGMTFHDGKPVTPEDVKFSFEYMTEWKQPYFKAYWDPIDTIELREGNVVRFNLKRPYAPFINISLSTLPILPKHVWDGVTEREGIEHPRQWANMDFTASGPFKLLEYEEGGEIVYEVFDDHFADFPFEKFIWNIYGSNTPAVGDLRKHRISYVQRIPAPLYEQMKGIDKVTRRNVPTHGWFGVYFQTQREPFTDPALRRAMSHVLDREQIIKTVYGGFATKAGSVISPANDYWYNPETPTHDGGLEKAKQILKDAGYEWDENDKLILN